jgi:gamma-glutamylputrescine oxidase
MLGDRPHTRAAAAGIRWRDGDGWHIAGTVPGGTVDPGALVAGLARAALAAGATIHEHTPVRRLDAGPPGHVHVDGYAVRADRVVVALNGYTAELVSLPMPLRAPLTLALCTAPVDDGVLAAIGLSTRAPFYTIDLPYLWGRWVAGGRLIFGAGLVFSPDGIVRHVDIGGAEPAAILTRLEARARSLHPALATITITHRWGGPIAFVARDTPLLGALPGTPSILVAAAYAGHGVALSVRVGRLLADAIVDGAPLPAWGALTP